MGPEALRTILARTHPEDLGLQGEDQILAHFETSVLSEASGTQIYSTTFVQWTAREALRRAQPLTLLARFSPRQRQKPMNELLAPNETPPVLDPLGSLVDADMGAYYSFLNLRRLPGSKSSCFVAWFEGHEEALVVSPSMPRGTESSTPATLRDLIAWAT